MRLRHSRRRPLQIFGHQPRWAFTYALLFGALLLLLLISTPSASALTRAFREQAPAVAPQPTSSPTPKPITGAVSIMTPTPAGGFRGDTQQLPVYVVTGTDVQGLILRDAPGGSVEIMTLPEGTRIYQIGPIVTASGRRWMPITTTSNQDGWVATDYLRAVR